MSRVGRPRKAGPRTKSGALRKPTLQQIKEAEAKEYRENMQTVANQPHRRNAPDPLDRRLSSALGRFCIAHGLRSELFDAGEEWGNLLRRWRAAKGVPDPMHTGGMGSGLGPSDDTVDGWERLIRRIEAALKALDSTETIWRLTRSICIDDEDPRPGDTRHVFVICGLRSVAGELGRLSRSAHPFVRAA